MPHPLRMSWPLRVAVAAVLAMTAACNAEDVGAKVDSAVASAKDTAADAATDAVKAEAEKRAAELKAAADEALQEQTQKAKAAAEDLLAAAAKTYASAKAVPSASPSAAAVAAVTKVVASPTPAAVTTHTVTGSLTTTQEYDVSAAYPPCATDVYRVGVPVSVRAGNATLGGSLTSCTWAGDYRTASPVFSLEVKNVPDATSYDVVIGPTTWTVSGPTLAASGWRLDLS
jgi:trimeric autotransporter adhesin